jgi:hypothetical protein
MARIAFDAVYLDHDVPKLGGHAGQVYANTSYFSSAGSYAVELDPSCGLVYVTHEKGGAIVVPLERVKRFEPLRIKPEEAATKAAKGGK